MSDEEPVNPAEVAARRAWVALEGCLNDGSSFVFEAGAGAGKTYSLLQALKFILTRRERELGRRHQQVACITFTNVARDNIVKQVDAHPIVYCDTTHAFAWVIISPFQKGLCELVRALPSWQALLAELGEVEITGVDYALGRRGFEDGKALLHHDDVFPIFIELLRGEKFRRILAGRFPIILVDEYQDTNAALVEALKEHVVGKEGAPQFGFFGDHWQKIYGDGCGSIEHPALVRIGKNANFRSAKVIVDCLNRMRPDLTQKVPNAAIGGSVCIFHTNDWVGNRRTGAHWDGDLPPEAAARAFEHVRNRLTENDEWNFDGDTKVLMLTHRALATRMGYASLPTVFQYNDSFTRKANDVVAFFEEHLEPAASAFLNKRYGAMFEAIDARRPALHSHADKVRWSQVMQRLCELREAGTVGQVLDHLEACRLPILSEKVQRLERELRDAVRGGQPLTRHQQELQDLRAVRYDEIVRLSEYLKGHSIFETQHGVKGDQFENVLVVFGRGWSEYNFNTFLEMAGQPPEGQQRAAYERYRNLFYVAISRPKTRLALLFTQRLSDRAKGQLAAWFEDHQVEDIGRRI